MKYLTTVVMLFLMIFASLNAQTKDDSVKYAEKGLKILMSNPDFLQEFKAEYGVTPLEFKMRNRAFLNAFNKMIIDEFTAGDFVFSDLHSRFLNHVDDYRNDLNLDIHDDSDIGYTPFQTRAPGGPCVNMDFEEGSLNGWEMYEGNTNANPAEIAGATQIMTAGVHHQIMTPGADPIVGIPTTNPNGGGFSLRLGDGNGTGARAASVRQTFMVSPANAVFTYSYAVVLEDPSGHTLGEKPFFKVNLYDAAGNVIPCGEFQVVADSGLDASWTNYGAGWYRDWSTVFAPLDNYIGQNVTIEFISGDCDQSGHYGYAYVDAECSPLDIIPPGTLICDGNPVTLTAPAGAASYAWSNGATTQSITTTTPGNYSVDVTPVTGAACATTLTATVNGSVGAPVAAFDALPTSICAGQTVSFSDQSTGTNSAVVDYWSYDFGDGSPVDVNQDATHAFASQGTYDVEFVAGVLVPGQGGCYDTIVQTITVDASPTANFTVDQVCEGTATQFTNTSTDAGTPITSYTWDFTSDGSVDNTTENPMTNMGIAATYNATLTASTAGGCIGTVTLPVIVDPIPSANFNAVDVCEGNVMSFTDVSSVATGTINAWAWDFGDATGTSIGQNPTYTYGNSGDFNVTLSVTSDQGCTDSYIDQVSVFENPIASFIVNDICDGSPFQFNDSSDPNGSNIVGWSWDFDADGNEDDNLQNPINLFGTFGTYSVDLTVTTTEGCVGTINQMVNVIQNPIAAFSVSQECEGVSTQFTDNSATPSGVITNWSWDYTSDGIIDNTSQNPINVVGNAGSYTAILTVTTDQGCTNTTSGPVVVDPIPVVDFSWTDVCEGEVMGFVDASSINSGTLVDYLWDFGDLIGSETVANTSYTYASPGVYSVVLAVTSDQGCVSSATEIVEMFQNPIADFATNDVCDLFPVQFNNISNANGSNFVSQNWDYTSDGFVDYNGVSSDFVYPGEGSYDVTLEVITTEGCVNSTTQTVNVFPTPQPNFTSQNVCEGNTVQFTNSSAISIGNINDYSWDFGNGGTSSLMDPSELYNVQGVYVVNLIVSSDQGCQNIVSNNVEIYPNPTPQFIANDVCDGNAVTIADFSSVNNSSTINNITSWSWDLGNGTTGNGQFPFANYTTPGTYTISLEVETNNGCVHSTSSDVTVHPNPVVDFSSPNPDGCAPWCTDFDNNSSIASGSIISYLWDFGDGNASTDEIPTNCYINPILIDAQFSVTLTANSDFGCSSSGTEFNLITVYPTPIADFTFNPEVGTIFEPTVDFTNLSQIADVYSWDFAGLTTSDEVNPSYEFPSRDSGTYEVCLDVSTIHGCVADTCKNVYIDGQANIYVPNAFTPDGDGVNDFFKPELYGFSEDDYEFMIFDRWGLMIFRSEDQQSSWNGIYKGDYCVQDAYVWKVKATDKYTGEELTQMGHITLLR